MIIVSFIFGFQTFRALKIPKINSKATLEFLILGDFFEIFCLFPCGWLVDLVLLVSDSVKVSGLTPRKDMMSLGAWVCGSVTNSLTWFVSISLIDCPGLRRFLDWISLWSSDRDPLSLIPKAHPIQFRGKGNSDTDLASPFQNKVWVIAQNA